MDIKDVENLAELARIELSGDEKKEILSFAKKHHIQPPSIYVPDYKEKYEHD